jgi:hypothetical protein
MATFLLNKMDTTNFLEKETPWESLIPTTLYWTRIEHLAQFSLCSS